MPGRYFLQTAMTDVAAELGRDASHLQTSARFNIAPGQEIPVVTADDITMMRWGIIPVGRKNARGRPVMETIINARSETVFEKSAFEGVQRCIVPADGWYEWTGQTRKKTAWRIQSKDRSLLWFAAIYDVWQAPGGLTVPQVATVTCEPNADVRDIHHRMGVILTTDQVPTWLTAQTEKAASLMQPVPDGWLKVGPADDVNWTAP